MTHRERILAFLRERRGLWHDDDELARALEIQPRQTVNAICRRLAAQGQIQREQRDGKIRNRVAPVRLEDDVAAAAQQTSDRTVKDSAAKAGGPSVGPSAVPRRAAAPAQPGGTAGANEPSASFSPADFEVLAAQVMSRHFGVHLTPGQLPGITKRFDLVSPDHQVVGDAKFYTMVRGQSIPPAKFSVIAEYVWLLEKTGALQPFLVFGNDRRVPEEWLQRYGHLAGRVAFYFLSPTGELEQMR